MNETEEERFARAAKKKRVDSLSDEVLNQFSEEAIKYVDPKTQEVKLRCKLCRKRDFRMVSSFEKHILEHKAGRIPTVSQQQQQTEETTGDSLLDCDECDRTFNTSKRLERHKLVHQSKKQPNEHECSRCEQTFDSRTILQAHFRKCVASPSVSPSKGSEKRKATLKAKEQMLRQLRGESEEDEDEDIIHEDDDHQMVTGEVVIQTEHSPTPIDTATGDEEPMVAMQHDDSTTVDGTTDGTELKFKILSEEAHEDNNSHGVDGDKQLSYQVQHQTGHGIMVDDNTIQQQPYQSALQQLSHQAGQDTETLVALNLTQNATSNEGGEEDTDQVVVNNLQQIINDPESNAAALSYVMQCVNQAVIANEQQQQVLAAEAGAAATHEDDSQQAQNESDILQAPVMTDDQPVTTVSSNTNELVVVSVPVSNSEGDENKEIVIVMEQQQQQQQSSDYELQDTTTDNNEIVSSETS